LDRIRRGRDEIDVWARWPKCCLSLLKEFQTWCFLWLGTKSRVEDPASLSTHWGSSVHGRADAVAATWCRLQSESVSDECPSTDSVASDSGIRQAHRYSSSRRRRRQHQHAVVLSPPRFVVVLSFPKSFFDCNKQGRCMPSTALLYLPNARSSLEPRCSSNQIFNVCG
jgi:hypothetical protein